MKIRNVLLLVALVSLVLVYLLEQGFKSQAATYENALPTPSPTPVPTPEIILTLEPMNLDYPKELNISDILDMSFGTNDVDCDGVENRYDNCVLAYNPNQSDKNKDGEGDVCDVKTGGRPDLQDLRCDTDGDGTLDRDDNCILVCNRKQADKDRDGVGDACDEKLRPNFQRIDFCPKRAKSSDRKAGGY